MHFATTRPLFLELPITFSPAQISLCRDKLLTHPRFFASISPCQHRNNIYSITRPTIFFRTWFYSAMARDETKASIFHHSFLDLPIAAAPQQHIEKAHYSP